MKFLCKLIGHVACGPYGQVVREKPIRDDLELFLYRCSRCKKSLRFRKNYPNGWEVVEEILGSC